MHIVFSGDISFSGIFAEQNEIDFIDPKILAFMESSDHGIFNIEGALSSSEFRTKKGTSLASSPDKINLLGQLKCDIFNLANNHIMDTGIRGLRETITLAEERGILTMGAGFNVNLASSPLFLEKNGISVALLAVCHPEGPIASQEDAGIFCDNQDKLLFEKIQKCKEKADWVILNYHGGEEFTFVPMPSRRKKLRKYVEWGVDIVIAHHPHVVQGYEKVKRGFIFYSLGNMIFDLESHQRFEGTRNSVLIKIKIKDDGVTFDVLGTEADLDAKKIRFAEKIPSFKLLNNDNYQKSWREECHRLINSTYWKSIEASTRVFNRDYGIFYAINRMPRMFFPFFKKIKFLISLALLLEHRNQRPKALGYLHYMINIFFHRETSK